MIKWVMADRLKINLFVVVMSEITIIFAAYKLCSMLSV